MAETRHGIAGLEHAGSKRAKGVFGTIVCVARVRLARGKAEGWGRGGHTARRWEAEGQKTSALRPVPGGIRPDLGPLPPVGGEFVSSAAIVPGGCAPVVAGPLRTRHRLR